MAYTRSLLLFFLAVATTRVAASYVPVYGADAVVSYNGELHDGTHTVTRTQTVCTGLPKTLSFTPLHAV